MEEILNQQIKVLQKLLKLPENKYCADCRRAFPTWASLNIGVFLCIKCSGCHRELGVNISKVKSTDLDKWSRGDIENFHYINNKIANEYWEKALMKNIDFAILRNNDGKLNEFIKAKYQQRKYAKVNQIDPMAIIIKMKNDKTTNTNNNSNGKNIGSLFNNNNRNITTYAKNKENNVTVAYQASLNHWVDKCDLIDDDSNDNESNIVNQCDLKENKQCFSLKKKCNNNLNNNNTMIMNSNYHDIYHHPHSSRNLPSKSYYMSNYNTINNNNNNNVNMTSLINQTMKQSHSNNQPTIQSTQFPYFDFTKVNQSQSYQAQDDPFKQFLKG